MQAPLRSVFALTILKKYPQLCEQPFAQVLAAWKSTDPSIAAYISPEEQQALNNGAAHAEWLEQAHHHTIVHWAALYGFTDVLEFVSSRNASLILAADDARNLPLHWAAKGGHVDTLEWLINFHKMNSAAHLLTSTGENGKTIAMLAAQYNHVPVLTTVRDDESIRSLLHVSSNAPKLRQLMPLQIAAQYGCVDSVEFFDKSGIDLNVTDSLGRGLGHYAAEGGHIPLLTLLNDSSRWKSLLLSTDKRQALPLHYAARAAKAGTVPFLHEKVGTPINVLDGEARSPAFWCIAGGKTYRHIECIKYMVSRGFPLQGVQADGYNLLKLVRDVHGPLCQMFQTLKGLGLAE